ncbi:MAG: glycosyltransferase [Candidatus Aenigmarchaeota archaeon]
MVSVIIPVYNGEKTIGECLSLLLKQTKKPEEIMVVDDGSTDNTVEIVKKIKGVKLIKQSHKGPASARNLGAKKAKGDILLFTDADCIPHRDWVSEMARSFENKETVGVQGRYETNQKGLIPRFVQFEIEDRYDRMGKREHIDFIGSYSAGYRKQTFLKFGGFDESFPIASGEDPELSFKISKFGNKMVFNDKAIVYHNHVDSLWEYLRQKLWRAYWRVLLYRKHPGKITGESYTPQILKSQIFFFYLCVLSAVFYVSIPYAIYLSLFSLILWVLSTLPLSYKNFKKDSIIGLSTPFISILRTIVFGLGLIYGVIRI